MKKASVTLTITLNMDVPDTMTKEQAEGSAYWLIHPFIEGFTDPFNGCTIEDFNIDTEENQTLIEY